MKKIFGLFLVLSVFLISCAQYSYVDVSNNEYAIMVPANGDTTQQGQLESFEGLNLVSGKRLVNPLIRYELAPGRFERKPQFFIYKVSRNPVSRKWTSETRYNPDKTFSYVKTGDMDGIATETRGSSGIMLGFTITYSVTEPIKFLWWQRDNTDLAIFGDNTIRNTLQKIVNEEVANYADADLTMNKGKLTASIQARLNDYYQKKYGITIQELGIVGGIQFDNADVQKQIDEAMIQKMARNAVEDQLATFRAKEALVQYERTWISINREKAINTYIEEAARKGYQIFPLVTGNGSAIIDISRYVAQPVK